MNKPTVDFGELEDAMLLAGDEAEAWVCRETGKIYVKSDLNFGEEADELPDDIDTSDQYIPLPGSRDLDLGHDLVLRFVEVEMPQEYEQVRQMFRKKGAYGRFSNLIGSMGLTDQWHRFRDEQTETALRSWCEDNGLDLQRKQ
jgi:hypothetical protein